MNIGNATMAVHRTNDIKRKRHNNTCKLIGHINKNNNTCKLIGHINKNNNTCKLIGVINKNNNTLQTNWSHKQEQEHM